MISPPTVSWIHFSDLHSVQEHGNSGFDQDIVLTEMLKDVRTLVHKHRIEVDAIFFTGDAADASAPGSYDEKAKVTAQFLDDLRHVAASKPIAGDRLFLVPGNHDVDRRAYPPEYRLGSFSSIFEKLFGDAVKASPAGEIFKRIREIDETLEEWTSADLRTKDWTVVIPSAFAAYMGLLQRAGVAPHLLDGQPKELRDRLIFSHEFRAASGASVRVLGLNTAWNCWGGSVAQKGQIRAGAARQLRLIGQHKPSSQDNKNGCTIALMHHPPSWLHTSDTAYLESVLAHTCDFILHGHEHMAMQFFDPIRKTSRIAAGACFTVRGETSALDVLRYSICEYRAEHGLLTIFPREFRIGERTWLPRQTPNIDPSRDWICVQITTSSERVLARPVLARDGRQSLVGVWQVQVEFDGGARWNSCTISLGPGMWEDEYEGKGRGSLDGKYFEFELTGVVLTGHNLSGRWRSAEQGNRNHGVLQGHLSQDGKKIDGRFLTSHLKRDTGFPDGGTWKWVRSEVSLSEIMPAKPQDSDIVR